MNLIKSTLINLKGHKLRVFVTLLWIVIGITSVVLISSVGNALKQDVLSSVNKISPNKTTIYFEPSDSNMMPMIDFLKPFTNEDLETLSFTGGVEKIGFHKDTFYMNLGHYTNGYFDKKNTYLNINYMKEDNKLKVLYGRNFAIEDDDRKVIIITNQNAIDLFTVPEKAIGKGITINGLVYEVIGVIDNSSSSNENDWFGDDFSASYIPKKSFDKLMNPFENSQNSNSIDLVVSKGYDLDTVSNDIVSKLYELHPDINGSYNIKDPIETSKELNSIVSNINKVISIITFISMFVGGIGVMNIMYVSVMERQREIGIRRAIGAKPRAILLQFLIESVFITVCGGILGIIIGFIVVNYVSKYLPFKALLNINSLIFAFITTIITGIVFGIIPAYKASKLDPIKAIYK